MEMIEMEKWENPEEIFSCLKKIAQECDRKGKYSETFLIKDNGRFNQTKRLDGIVPYLLSISDVKKPEDLYKLMQEILLKHPDFDVSFKVDPEGKWMKYMIKGLGNK